MLPVCIRGQVRRVENAGGRCEKGWSPPCHMLNAGLCALMAGYVKMNSSLRLASGKLLAAHLKGNRYVNTIYLCASAMNKISQASRIPRGRKVYRGMAGIKLPDIFVVPGEDGGRGGDEFAFMSCSTNREVAVSYIDTMKGLPILFEFDVGSIDRGAPLSFLSQYPSEVRISSTFLPPVKVEEAGHVICSRRA